MTKTIREKLQALVNEIDQECKACECEDCKWETLQAMRIKARIESILATEEQEVRVRKGWVCKDRCAIVWTDKNPTWADHAELWITQPGSICVHIEHIITDPWPDHPNGGPECIREVG